MLTLNRWNLLMCVSGQDLTEGPNRRQAMTTYRVLSSRS